MRQHTRRMNLIGYFSALPFANPNEGFLSFHRFFGDVGFQTSSQCSSTDGGVLNVTKTKSMKNKRFALLQNVVHFKPAKRQYCMLKWNFLFDEQQSGTGKMKWKKKERTATKIINNRIVTGSIRSQSWASWTRFSFLKSNRTDRRTKCVASFQSARSSSNRC